MSTSPGRLGIYFQFRTLVGMLELGEFSECHACNIGFEPL